MNTGHWARDGFPKYTTQQIVELAEYPFYRLVDRFGFEGLLDRGYCFDDVYEEVLRPEFNIALDEDRNLGCDAHGRKILGRFDIGANRVEIDRSLRVGTRDPRRVFTCWHEVSHVILHGPWLRKRLSRGAIRKLIVTTADVISSSGQSGLERQANLFAAHASAPKEFVVAVALTVLDLTGPIPYIGPGSYDLNPNGRRWSIRVKSFDEFCRHVARTMRHRFGGLSVESLSYRIRDLNIVVDKTAVRAGLHRIAG